jgi:putative spermidine/putrescine transport system substrate-binding protein
VPVEFVAPKEGAIAFRTTMHITKNSANAELAFKLIEAALSPEVQETLMASPYFVVPTNTKVKIAGEVAKTLVADQEAMRSRFVFQDWARINEQRASWLERFNRDMRA